MKVVRGVDRLDTLIDVNVYTEGVLVRRWTRVLVTGSSPDRFPPTQSTEISLVGPSPRVSSTVFSDTGVG